MSKMEYLQDMPIAVLGGGAVGKTCAADMKLAGKEVRLYDAMPFAASSLKDVEKTGILLDGVQRNKYCFERSGRAFFGWATSLGLIAWSCCVFISDDFDATAPPICSLVAPLSF